MPKSRKSAFDSGYLTIVARLTARRRELGMTQAHLAEAYGEDQSFISRVERKQRRLDVWEFVRLCRVLELHPSQVLDDL